MSRRSSANEDRVMAELRAFGAAYPGAHSKSPWPGHDDLAVNSKTFAYLSVEGEPFSMSVKLPFTGEEARSLPFARPAEYGLGKSGWVVFEPGADQMPPMRQLKSWLDESYRAQAPKKLVALIPQDLLAQIRDE
jgi:predicted DNA-binding protein (MmcQ/YjbR family)